MNIYHSLQNDHKVVSELLDQLVETSDTDNKKWKGLLEQIRDELIPHLRAEEAVFYNAVRELDPTTHVIKDSYVEHATAEADLRALQTLKAVDINFKNLVKKLRADILLHVQHEESQVFAAAQTLFSEEEAKMIGKAFHELKAVVKKQSDIGTTVDLISNLLPRRLVEGFKKAVSKDEKRSA